VAQDDLNAPLGQNQKKKKKRHRLPVAAPQIVAGALGLFGLVAVGWAMFGNDPLGGQPVAVVSTTPADAGAGSKKAGHPQATASAAIPGPTAKAAVPAGGRTITIIDGSSGTHHDVVVPGSGGSTPNRAGGHALLQKSSAAPIPKLAAAGGNRPFVRYASRFQVPANRKDAPRIAIVVGDLGISDTATAAALAKLPAPVTLAFAPYGDNLRALAAHARNAGHEVLLQVPMEPLDYPNNDPGPETLLTSLSNKDNIKRLHWVMGRMSGYVGLASYMGARFTANTQALTPVLREIARRGLIYVDDGSSARSVAGQIAGTLNLPFAKADSVLDAVPTPVEIERALRRLEMTARAKGVAVGYASAQESTIAAIDKWAKGAKRRGILLVPITVVAVKSKSS
jgi:uncharacterized protein